MLRVASVMQQPKNIVTLKIFFYTDFLMLIILYLCKYSLPNKRIYCENRKLIVII